MKNLETLLPCPFCGGKAEVFPLRGNCKKYKFYYPTCLGEIRDNCPGIVDEQDEQGGTGCDCLSVKEAISLWNERA